MFVVRTNKGVQDIDDGCEGDCQIGNRSILPPQEGFCTCFDSIGNDPHLVCPGITLQDIPDQIKSEQESQEANTEYQIKFHAVWTTPFERKIDGQRGPRNLMISRCVAEKCGEKRHE